MMRYPQFLVWLALMSAVLRAGAAHAQAAPAKRAAPPAPAKQAAPQRPSQKEIDEARKHFQRAEAAKARGEYQTAAVEYLAAYELFQEPAFFYNTAEVYRLAGDEKNALVYYTKYLELAPDGKAAASARIAADQLRRAIAAQEDAARIAEEARRKAEADARRNAENEAKARADQDAKAAAARKPERVHAQEDTGRSTRIAGLVTGGIGAAAVGIGVVFGVRAHELGSETAGWDNYDRKRDEQGRADQRNMIIFTGVGAAALVAGGVLYYLGHRSGSADRAISVSATVGPSHALLGAAGRF
jgi:tetratricopeptide (TPR) repeat protein